MPVEAAPADVSEKYPVDLSHVAQGLGFRVSGLGFGVSGAGYARIIKEAFQGNQSRWLAVAIRNPKPWLVRPSWSGPGPWLARSLPWFVGRSLKRFRGFSPFRS